MARITYGPLITELAGSIGGVTFLRNASGPIAKLRTNPIVNPSPYQSTYQTNLSKLVAYWPTLSQPNKKTWNDLAEAHDHTTPWGETKTLSGYQWFTSVNLFRLLKGADIRSTAPPFLSYPAVNTFTLTATSTYLRCNWASAYTPNNYLIIYLTLPLRQSSLKLRRSLFYVGFRTPNGSITTLDLTSYFESLANVTWATFFAFANCSIICRLRDGSFINGQWSSFTSAIVKIG